MVIADHQSMLSKAAYAVPGPRSTDAIGAALRGAFDGSCPLPEAMAAALRALDRA